MDNNEHCTVMLPPDPNVKISVGGYGGFVVEIYCENPPNRFQRWMLQKFFGLTWELM